MTRDDSQAIEQGSQRIREDEGFQPARFFPDKIPAGPGLRNLTRRCHNVEINDDGIQKYCNTAKATPLEVFLAAFRAVHYLLTDVEDASIRVIETSRRRPDLGNEKQMNSRLVRMNICDESFQDLVQSASTAYQSSTTSDSHNGSDDGAHLGTSSSQQLPTATLVFASGSQVDTSDLALGRIDSLLRPLRENGESDIEFLCWEKSEGFSGCVAYSEDRHVDATAANIARMLGLILDECVSRPTDSIASLSLREPHSMAHETGSDLPATEDNPDESEGLSVIDGFRYMVDSCPERIAVQDATSQLTYQELDEQSDRIAGWLLRQRCPRGGLVAVIGGRSCQSVIAFLGILKLDMAYVPLDAGLPRQRIETIMSSLPDLCLVLLGPGVELEPSSAWKRTLAVEEVLGQGSGVTTVAPELGPTAKSLAYIIFTSGSTGLPKGVMVEHGGIVRLVQAIDAISNVESRDQDGDATESWAHIASISFDVSVMEIYTALLTGVRLVCIDDTVVWDPKRLGQTFADCKVRQAFMTPALVNECLKDNPDTLAALSTIYAGGERLDPEVAKKAAPLVPNLYNAYGPTEATVLSTVYHVSEKDHCANGVPIGAPFPHVATYIIGRRQQLLPVGQVGELVLAGEGLARGYTDPSRNVDRFIDIEVDGRAVRAYRTGDSARCRPSDLQIEFLGRIDNQVKIRGFRIELEEIERALLNSSLVNEAVALAVKPEGADQQIVSFVSLAYKTASESKGTEEDQSMLLSMLRSQLPKYMVPSIIEIVDNLPTSHTGKIDRKVLKTKAEQLPVQRTSSKSAARPRNQAERVLCDGFSHVLGVDGVGVQDNFIELGGHSLTAMRLVSHINKQLGTASLTVGDVLSNPVIEDLALRLQQSSSRPEPSNIPRLQHTDPATLSYAQGRLWFLEKLYPNSTGYIIPLAVRLHGPLNLNALEAALHAIESRHETLRTTFSGGDGDHAIQHVIPFAPSSLRVIDAPTQTSKFQELMDKEQWRPFDLESEPGWRVAVFRLTHKENILSVVMHHISSDGWSVDILCRELNTFYSAALRGEEPASQLPPLPVQYRDYAAWEQNPSPQAAERHQQQLDYWLEQLEGSKAAELTPDKPRPAVLAGKTGKEAVAIEGKLYSDLQDFSTSHKVTPYVTLLSAFRASLYRLTGLEDCNIGIANANRSHIDLEDLIGFFVNLQCIRLPVFQDETFGGLLSTTHATVAAAHDHSDVPFERVISAMGLDGRDASRNPLVQLSFVLHSQNDLGQIRLEGVDAEETIMEGATSFDLEFHLFQEDNRLRGYVLFATCLFEAATIQNLISVFNGVLQQALRDPSVPLAGMSLCTTCPPAVLESAAPPLEKSSIVDVFRRVAAASPSRVAVKDSSAEMTYSELDERSSLLSQWLLGEGLPSETIIGVLANRSCETIVTFFGILKANMAYLPVDANQPWARVEETLLTVQGERKYLFVGADIPLPASNNREINVLRLPKVLRQQMRRTADTSLHKMPSPTTTSLAYVIFSSGSTGKPKGILIEHRGVVRMAQSFHQFRNGGASAHMSSISFDMSVWEIYTSLLNGGTLVCIDSTLDFPRVAETFATESIRTGVFTPLWVNQCLAQCPQLFNGMDLVFIAGDALNPQDTRDVVRRVQGDVYNAYGPTECTVIGTSYRLAPNDIELSGTVPIGEPVNNTGVMVLDFQQKHLVPRGVIGELLLTGEGLARGYTQDELTRRSFIEVAIDDGSKAVRAYRTGDAVRVRPVDGQLETFGRIDNQVKVRGYRVELAEVERALSDCDGVQSAAVIVHAINEQERELVAFVTLHPEEQTNAIRRAPLRPHRTGQDSMIDGVVDRDLKRSLSERLPLHMVPTTVHVIDKMPITRSGKVDRAALLDQMTSVDDDATPDEVLQDYDAPRDAIEAAICEEFGRILKTQAIIGVNDNFFQLGGHSLMAVSLISRLNKRLGTSIAIRDLFDHPVVADLSATIRPYLGAHDYDSIAHAPYAGPTALSYAQTRLWFTEQLSPGSVTYIMPIVFRLRGQLSLESLEDAVNAVTARHEILRTTFEEVDGEARQRVHAHQTSNIAVIPVRGQTELDNKLREDRNSPFDLHNSPAYRVALYQMDKQEHVFCFSMHHIISDGWSMELLCRELAKFYAASLDGQDLQSLLPPLPIQYRDFAQWQKEETQIQMQEKQLAYWTQHLENPRAAELLTDYPRPSAALSGHAGLEEIEIDGSLFNGIHQFCQTNQVTPFMLLLSVFRAAHYRLTGVQDAIIGTANANRNREELEHLIGFFVNPLPLRIKVDGETESLSSLVQQVRDTVAAAQANQDVPFERIVAALQLEHRDVSRSPLAQLTFALHTQQDHDELPLRGLESSRISEAHTTRFDLEFHLFQEADGFRGWVLYEKDLFESKSIRALLDVFDGVLREGLRVPEHQLQTLCLYNEFSPVEEVPSAALGVSYGRQSTIVQQFQRQVASQPNAIAVKDSSQVVTYAELDRLSERVACWLVKQRLEPESWIGVLSGRSCQTIVAFLGILKANLAYMPLDETLPPARVQDFVSAIPGKKLVFLGPRCPSPQINVDCQFEYIDCVIYSEDSVSPGFRRRVSWAPPTPSSLAYVMFTSGSTGKPKGVMIEHRSIVRVAACTTQPELRPEDGTTAHMASISFDMSVWEIYGTILNGYSLVCIDKETLLDQDKLSRTFVDPSMPVRRAALAPVLLKHTLKHSPETLANFEFLAVAGDRLDPHDAKAVMACVKQGKVYDAWGPTENSVVSSMHELSAGEDYVNGVPIGRSVLSSGVYVVDKKLQQVPHGVIGELVVTGDGLARGYTDPSRNGAFQNISVNGKTVRAYLTGDFGRYRPTDLMLEFFGRKDNQVKIRGHRVELAEIERALLACEEVADAALVTKETQGQLDVVAYVTLSSSASASTSHLDDQDLLTTLRTQLPSFMLPSAIHIIDSMPLNSSGKVDRKALASTELSSTVSETSQCKVLPRSAIEKALCDEFAAVLESEVGATDNFFLMGGHSEMAMRLVSSIKKRLETDVGVADLFACPTVEGLAKRIDTGSDTVPDAPFATDLESLEEDLAAALDVKRRPFSPQRVFLTGATGYFGAAILHTLLQQDKTRRVSVLVRASSIEVAMARIIHSAMIAGWWELEYASRIEVWLGDLELPKLGLVPSQWERLSGKGERETCIDAIVHNGARVDWYSTYDQLRAANVMSTYQLLEVAGTSEYIERFLFVSTGGPIDMQTQTLNGRDFRQELSRANGYAQSKLSAEHMIQKINLQGLAGDRLAVLKPGFIIGDHVLGVANSDDYLWRVIAACVTVGSFPQEPEASWVHISSHDSLANTVLKCLDGSQTFRPRRSIAAYGGGLPSWKFWRAVCNSCPFTKDLAATTVEEWKKKLEVEILNKKEEDHQISVVWPFLRDNELVVGEVDAAPETTIPMSEEAERQLEAAIGANVRYLSNQGYFSPGWSRKRNGVFSRKAGAS
ncbi:AMP-binding enzyme domain-containing protein [Sarocladium implicatum]|nr:AMP-binding enzyme domain-containing protein [Sarocladium implicatum]